MALAQAIHAHPGLSVCPACAGVPSAHKVTDADSLSGTRRLLSLPLVHCAACITTVEAALRAVPGVHGARVNLTRKQVAVVAAPDLSVTALVAALQAVGQEAHELDQGQLDASGTDRQASDLLMRLGVAFFAMMNVMLLSVAVWSGATEATRDLFHWISAGIALPTVAFAGQPFFRSARASLRAGRLGMDVPISLALILASVISVYETTQSGHHAYFDAAVMLAFFLLLGRYLDHRTRAAARSAAEELTALEVPRAVVLVNGIEQTRAISEVRVGDLVLVRPGARMPVDGVVVGGTSELDRSLLTGESLPVFAGPGTLVSAGEANLTGPLTLSVTAAGRCSSLHRMAELVAVAESARTRFTTLADRAARIYSPLVHLLSFSAFGYWMWATGGDLRFAINISAAVLIITCPCALGLAVPAVVTAASGRLFRLGLLIKDGTALERLAKVDTVVFDKTGTLTQALPEPADFDSLPEPVRAVARSLAAGSDHPLARALAALPGKRAEISDLTETPGQGVEARFAGKSVRLGRAEWCGAMAVGGTASYLRIGQATYAIGFSDRLRPGAADLVRGLRKAGLRVILLSGDAPGPVSLVAGMLGIEDWQARVLPAEKAARVQALSRKGHHVLMIGDGLNDTGALALADVSISPASALDAARAASDIVLLGQDLAPIADALRISRQATRRMVENFAISAGYNVIAVPLALAGAATPLAAALAMSLSSITVALNAMRLR